MVSIRLYKQINAWVLSNHFVAFSSALFSFHRSIFISTVGFSNEENCCLLQKRIFGFFFFFKIMLESWGCGLYTSAAHTRVFTVLFKKLCGKILWYREKKSLCHDAMVAKFLDDNKPKMSLRNWIHTVSDFSDLVQFHFICQMLANFSGVKSERTVSRFRKRKRKLLRSFKPEHEIRKFHVPVMQWWLRSVQKTVMYMQSYWIDYINLLFFFAVLVAVAIAVAIAINVA